MPPFPSVLAGVVLVVALVALSGFFSSTESAIFTLPADWVPDATDDGRAAALQELRADPHRLLVTILVGNNVVNVAIGSISTVLLLEFMPAGRAATVATVLASFVVLVFGEIVPKSYGLGHAKSWALTVARPVRVVELALYPLVSVFDVVTRQLNAVVGGDPDVERPYVDDQ